MCHCSSVRYFCLQGDSGGSQVCKRGDTWYQNGALSYGPGCGWTADAYNVYASVEYHLEWINSVMSRN